jgi:hypothetical protein
LPVAEDTKVLDVDPLDIDTVLAVESVVDELLLWVEIVQNNVRVALVTGSEHDHLEVLVNGLQALKRSWSNVNPSVYNFSRRERYRKHDIWIGSLDIIAAVDKGLVQVENDRLSIMVPWTLRQVQFLATNLTSRRWWQLPHELQSLKRLEEMLFVDQVAFFPDLLFC